MAESAVLSGTREVQIPCGAARLAGELALPAEPTGLVLFAHGSGSSRHSPRNRQVAQALRDAGLGTLLLDLLTPEEAAVDERTREHRFDIGLLTARLECAAEWADRHAWPAAAQFGLFGASTGSAAALIAASRLGRRVGAVVSRGGRTDLAGPVVLRAITAPTLFIAGSQDPKILAANRLAARHLRCPHAVEVVPGATHLFEEPGALEQVAQLAARWFTLHLAP